MFQLPVFIASSPNTDRSDVWMALKTILQPWKWNDQKYNDELKNELGDYLGVKSVFTCDSGRTSLYLILKALGIGPGDEVILPSFTCLVVANAVKWSGATPIYLDTNKDDFNANYDDIEKYLTSKTKAVIVQHTFGKMVNVANVRSQLIAQGSHPVIIEDWAHTLKRNQKLEGDIAFLTFGIEKIISTVRGGAVVTNSAEIGSKLESEISKLPKFPRKQAFIALTNPIFWHIDVPMHQIGVGKYNIGVIIRGIWRKMGMLGRMIEKEEHKGDKPKWFPAKLSPALARLGLVQIRKLDEMNKHRLNIAKIYHENFSKISDQEVFDWERIYLRYPILLKDVQQKKKVWDIAKKMNITLGDWYKKPLYSKYVNEETYKINHFDPATCPSTVDKCTRVLNLPTAINITEDRASGLTQSIIKDLP